MPSLTKARADHNTFDGWQCCVKRLISHPKCCCLECSGEGIPHQMPCSRWTLNGNTSNSCDGDRIWYNVGRIVAKGFIASFVTSHDGNVYLEFLLFVRALGGNHIGPTILHFNILNPIPTGRKDDLLDVSVSVLGQVRSSLLTIHNPTFQPLEYVLVDGKFRDAQNCNRILRPIEEPTRITPTVAHICDPSFVPSSLGTHAALRMSARREHPLLLIRILIGLFSKVVLRAFLRLHSAGLKVETMPPCGHNTSRSLSVDSFGVFPTSVIAPLAPEHVLYGVIWENVKVYNPWIYQLTVRLLTCFLYPQPNSC